MNAKNRRKMLEAEEQLAKMSPQQRVARELDAAAARADLVDARPATPKQCWFLAGLMVNAGVTPDAEGIGYLNSRAILTSAKASKLIDEYLQN